LSYCPLIGTIPSDLSTSWHFLAGKWVSRKRLGKQELFKFEDKYDNKFGELAIKITLTN
jgi:hypothetical protein